jgi:transposase
MGTSISSDLRRRVVDSYLAGYGTYSEIAKRFNVGEASVSRWLRKYRETGTVNPKPHGGGTKAKIDEKGLALLKRLVSERPDATLKELAQSYENARAVKVALCIIYRALNQLGLTRKKKRFSHPSRIEKT